MSRSSLVSTILGVNCACAAMNATFAGIAMSGRASSTMRASAPMFTLPARSVGR